jgi:hypothetical protein
MSIPNTTTRRRGAVGGTKAARLAREEARARDLAVQAATDLWSALSPSNKERDGDAIPMPNPGMARSAAATLRDLEVWPSDDEHRPRVLRFSIPNGEHPFVFGLYAEDAVKHGETARDLARQEATEIAAKAWGYTVDFYEHEAAPYWRNVACELAAACVVSFRLNLLRKQAEDAVATFHKETSDPTHFLARSAALFGDAYCNSEIMSLLLPIIGVAERATRNVETNEFVSDITPEVFDQVIDVLKQVKENITANLIGGEWLRSPFGGPTTNLCHNYDGYSMGQAITILNHCEEQIRKILPGLFR